MTNEIKTCDKCSLYSNNEKWFSSAKLVTLWLNTISIVLFAIILIVVGIAGIILIE